jgi:catechol 2,3-dioxygenase-like lactoylglutathione lyase family enzyme
MVSAMKLMFMFVPVKDLKESVAFYRDSLGLDEAWREGDTTVAFTLPGSEIQLMLDTATGDDWLPGGFFEVDSVEKFIAEHPDFSWAKESIEVPGGRGASFRDPSGNVIYLFDQTEAGPE